MTALSTPSKSGGESRKLCQSSHALRCQIGLISQPLYNPLFLSEIWDGNLLQLRGRNVPKNAPESGSAFC